MQSATALHETQSTAIKRTAAQEWASAIPLALIGLMIAAALFSVFFMLPQSVGLDESQSLWQSAHTIPGIFFVVAQDVHVPLYHVILHFWQITFGNSIPAARALSLIFYLPSIPLAYILGKVAFKRSIGLIGAIIFTLSPFANWYGSIIRMYSLLTLLTLINQICFLLIYKGRANERTKYWLGYFISAAFGIYTHYFFFFNLIAQAMFFFAYRNSFAKGSFKKLALIAVILAVLFTPWIWYVHGEGGLGANTAPQLLPPTTIDVFNTFSNFLFGFQIDAVNAMILALWPLVTLLLFLALQRHKNVSAETAYLVIATFAPIFGAAIVSHIIKPFFLSRYFISVLPAFCLLITWFLWRYGKTVRTIIAAILVIAMASGLFIQTTNANAPVKENYRDAAEYLTNNASGRDIVAVSTPFTIYPIEYYYRGTANVITLPEWNRLITGPIPSFSTTTLTENAQSFKTYDHLWLVLSYDQGYEEPLRLYFDTHFQRLTVQHFSPGLDIYEYRMRYDEGTLTTLLSKK